MTTISFGLPIPPDPYRWASLAAVCMVLLPGAALSATYEFSSTETSALGNPAYSFTLNTADAVIGANGTTFSDVTISDSGTTTTGNTVTFEAPSALSSSLFFFIDTDVPGPKAFGSGSGTSTVFDPGTYSIADGFTDGEGTLTITQVSGVSGVPLPASAPMLGSALVALGAVGYGLKRKAKAA